MDVMRLETEDNRELGKNCGQSLSQALGLKFNLNFVSLAELGREREEGEGETGRENTILRCLLNFLFECFKMLSSFNVVSWYRFLQISN